jgi:hypothetical protein
MRVRVLILTLIVSFLPSFADTTLSYPTVQSITVQKPQIPITQPQNVAFEDCTKMFEINKEKLFYLTLGAVSANRFTVEEIQTSNGYIIFTAANNKYLATIAGIDANNSILKITPCNDIYFFPPGVILGMFKYIEINVNTELK